MLRLRCGQPRLLSRNDQRGKMLAIDLSTFSPIAKVGVFLVMGVAFIALGAFCPLPPEKGGGPEKSAG